MVLVGFHPPTSQSIPYGSMTLWSAPAERSGDGAFPWRGALPLVSKHPPKAIRSTESQSAVAAALCRRTP